VKTTEKAEEPVAEMGDDDADDCDGDDVDGDDDFYADAFEDV
jgi:hypothetical protein